MLIGREPEIARLEKVYQSNEAEFIVLYGRRRVGKTYLIRHYFAGQECLFFQATGLQKGSLKKQLSHFAEALSKLFTHGIEMKAPLSWDEAFKILTQFMDAMANDRKIVIFLDELPWMATRRSRLLESLDYYWNQYWSANPKIILVVCGSSASWLINNLIYNKGGLHNRCTCEIKLDPFTLRETFSYLTEKGVRLNHTHVLDLYMALGGIPFYLNYVEPGLTAAENIQNIFFSKKAPLRDEFNKLFKSLFTDAEAYVELVTLIAQKKEGFNRSELESMSTLSKGGGRLTQRLIQLQQISFIESYVPWDKVRGEYYKVIDECCLFYIYWVSSLKMRMLTPDYWLMQANKPSYHAWAGSAFEAICYKHIVQIIKALNIKTAENIASWRLTAKVENEHGAQIDLLIDRADDAITLCEIKYTSDPFVIDKDYAEKLNRKITIFQKATNTKKLIFLAFISATGVKENIYAKKMVDGVATLENLFEITDKK